MGRVIVAGSRSFSQDNFENRELVYNTVEEAPFNIADLVHGGADGVDAIAGTLAEVGHIDVDKISVFEPDWERYGKAAGPMRNQRMAEYADALIAVWDGESSGTLDMIERALDEGLDVYVKQDSDESQNATEDEI